jgi:nicotinate-nucleotide adenylyltransferase
VAPIDGGATIGRMTAKRIGILGGTFDPIHFGHLSVAEAAETALGLTKMYVVTANAPPHRPQPVASPFQRYAMVVMAVGHRPGWRASDMELRLHATSYTADTLARFHDRGYRPEQLFFVLGADAFAEIESWRGYPAILDAAHFAVVSRPGMPVAALRARLPAVAARMTGATHDAGPARTMVFLIDAATADVSGTAIRAKCEAGESIAGLVPPIIEQYIEQHGLYGPKGSGRRASDTQAQVAAGRLHGQE